MAMNKGKGYLSMWVLINDDMWMCSLKGAARWITEDEWTTEPKMGHQGYACMPAEAFIYFCVTL